MIRKIAKSIIPSPVWNFLGTTRRSWVTRDDEKLSTREVFSRIYEKGLWGGEGEEFSSGAGSRTGGVVEPYVDAIGKWASENGGRSLTAVDVGCGDFHVGRRVFPLFGRYLALDIVPDLIAQHREGDYSESVDFRCVDAIDEDLPDGDVIFVRQVLQHLSNEQIGRIVPKLSNFRHAIITEHLPALGQLKTKNANKLHGGGIRLAQGSGIFLEEPPFSLRALASEVLLEVAGGDRPERDGIIRTTAYRFQ